MAEKSIVDLNKDEKTAWVTLTQKGRPGARKIKRANILLLADTGKPDFEIAELFSPWQVGGTSKSPISELNRISLGAYRIWLKYNFQKQKKSGACWITSTPIRPPPFTLLLRLSKRGT